MEDPSPDEILARSNRFGWNAFTGLVLGMLIWPASWVGAALVPNGPLVPALLALWGVAALVAVVRRRSRSLGFGLVVGVAAAFGFGVVTSLFGGCSVFC